MEQLAIEVELCSDLDTVAGRLCRSKFDAIMVDFKDCERASKLLNQIHGMTSHRRAVVIALLGLDGNVQDAFQAGANFTLERSLNLTIVNRTLRAAYPLMIRERRRYFRCPFRVPVDITIHGKSELQVHLINISEGGMAIESSAHLHVGTRFEWDINLQGIGRLNGIGEICWNDDDGRMGIQFVHLHSSTLERLQTWLLDQLQESLLVPAGESDVTYR